MPITTANRQLSEADKRKLLALADEAKRRGIKFDIKSVLSQDGLIKKPFHRDMNGYFVKNDGKQYNPNDAQRGFVASQARFVGFYGSRGSGKSSGGAQKALDKIDKGESGMVLNPDFENFKTSTWPEFREWIPWKEVVPQHRYRQEITWEPQKPFVIVFTSGARVLCKGLKDPNSARGPNMNWLWYDEAQRDETGEAWKIAVACVRVGKDPQAWATYTPRGTYHWTTEFFLNESIPQEVIDLFAELNETRPLIEVFHGTMLDNQANLDPGFFASMMMAYDGENNAYLKEREVYGNVADEGKARGNKAWFDGKVVDKVPFDVTKKVRYWDLAGSERKLKTTNRKNDPDSNAGTLLSWDGKRDFCIEHQISGRWSWGKLNEIIVQTAEMDGPFVKIFIEQEGASGGINQIEAIKVYVKEHCKIPVVIEEDKPQGDKDIRANPWFEEAEHGHFWMLKGSWNNPFLAQLASFGVPGVHDDLIDSVSGARKNTAPFFSWKEIGFLAL